MNLHALWFAWLENGCVEFHFLSTGKKLVPLSTPDSGFTGNSLVSKNAGLQGAQPGPAAQSPQLVVARRKATRLEDTHRLLRWQEGTGDGSTRCHSHPRDAQGSPGVTLGGFCSG